MAAISVAALLAGLTLLAPGVAHAQDKPVPYWASIRSPEVNMRVGPSGAYPISWVYRRQGLPVRVVRRNEGWRLVEDPDGTRGWITAALLNPRRGALVIGEGVVPILAAPDAGAALRWRAQPGVVGVLGECEPQWCEIDIEGRVGWVSRDRLWGDGEP